MDRDGTGGWLHTGATLPTDGQSVYYFGPAIGLHIGTYRYAPDDNYSHHLFHNADWGVVDRMDAPWWRPYDPERAKAWVPLPPPQFTKGLHGYSPE